MTHRPASRRTDRIGHNGRCDTRLSRPASVPCRPRKAGSASGCLPALGARRRWLLAGVSLLTLFVNAPAMASNRLQASTTGATSSTTASTTSTTGSTSTSTATTTADLVTAAHSFKAALAAQAAAAKAALAAATNSVTLSDGRTVAVTDGLSSNGLVVDPRVAFDSSGSSTTTGLWSNISAPVQTTSTNSSGTTTTTVTLTQSSAQAIATWYKFNVGANTTVYFDQSAGTTSNGNSWVVLNRIDATGTPSVILGTIKAEGTVLVINPNGIVFGAGSQVNVHTLIASAMDINGSYGVYTSAGTYTPYSLTVDGTVYDFLAPANETSGNSYFLENGLYDNTYTTTQNVDNTSTSINHYVASFAVNSGKDSSGNDLSAGMLKNYGVTVEKGATLSTLDYVSGADNGGYVALLGPQVTNAGLIETSAGQIILASGASLYITEPDTANGGTAFSVATVATSANLLSKVSTLSTYDPSSSLITVSGATTNTADGVLYSQRGDITLFGATVEQDGVLEATTSITRPGTITITAAGSSGTVTFGADSTTAIVSAENGETIVESSISDSYTGPSITILATNFDMASGALIVAPSATMTIDPYLAVTNNDSTKLGGRVLFEDGSVVDLGGMAATANVSDYLYTFKVTANDVADTPEATALIGQTVTIDLRLSGTRSDGETWVGSPLFAATGSGYLGNVAYSLDMLLTTGGSLTIGSTAAFTDVLTPSGSAINVSGGTITYSGALVTTTNVKTAYGTVVNIGSANPFIEIIGLPGTLSVTSDRWDVTTTYSNRLIPTTSSYYDDGYTDGLSAGSLSVTAINPILEGTIEGNTYTGSRQASRSVTSAAAALTTPDDLPTGASLTIVLVAGTSGDVVLASQSDDVLAGVTLTSTLNGANNVGVVSTITYSTDLLTAENLGSITIRNAAELSMAAGASLAVRAGGSITLANVTEIDGTLTAHGGSITITGFVPYDDSAYSPTSSLIIGSSALLDVSGLWVNDAGLTADTMTGWAWIDGGSVTLKTYMVSDVTAAGNGTVTGVADETQSIVLSSGSVIDLSSGGYVTIAGKLKTASDGLPSGTGGSLTLETYAASSKISSWSGRTYVDSYNPNSVAPDELTASVTLGGVIYAGGLNQGGTLTLEVPSITIDGSATQVTTDAATGAVTLPTSFFTQGFSSYVLGSTYGSITVAADTTLTLTQRNYLLSADVALPATGASLRDFATLGYAEDGLRQPVDLSLIEQAYVHATDSTSESAGIIIGTGASIVADPGAAITLTANGAITILGSLISHGGSITITEQDTTQTLTGSSGVSSSVAQLVWIGSDAVLDVSGTYVADPTETAYSTGTVSDGGTITISSDGTIVVLKGATLDIAGASATVQVPTGGTTGLTAYTTERIWSDGGSITLYSSKTTASTANLYFAGTIEAAGGSAEASGGTFSVGELIYDSTNYKYYAQGYGTILISQGGDVSSALATAAASLGVPAKAGELATLLSTAAASSGYATSGYAYIAADTLNTSHSGLDSVSLTGTTIAFAGNVALTLPDALYLNGNILLLPAGATTTAAATASVATTVDLSAGYIRWLAGSEVVPGAGGGTLDLDATAQIDLAGVVSASYADSVNLTVSDGDIRFLPVTDSDIYGYVSGLSSHSLDFTGGTASVSEALLVPGDLTLTAREVYPATSTTFLLASLGLGGTDGGTITIRSNGQGAYIPYSAGGAVLVDAATIVQAGSLIAPLGTIILGLSDAQSFGSASLVATGAVTLASGSLTATSANGSYIPYGTTVDGETWTVNGTEISGPPAKLIVLAGGSVVTESGATIDESGGGDVYATEFVPGTGGSRNLLSTNTSNYGTTQTVYALVPAYEAKVAAYDATIDSTYDTTYYTTVKAGTAVTLTGGNGIAAGTYVLLPAMYATLPGAYRVVVVSTNTGSAATYSRVAADGSVTMTGTLANAITGATSSATALFQIQSESTWSKYSEIDLTYGDSYFSGSSARLARDAGQMIVAATNSLSLAATNDFTAAAGGRGGEIDITGSSIVVQASDQTSTSTTAGAIVLDADQISALGVESVLIGGYRSTSDDGVVVTTTARTVEVETDSAHPLSGPEILLAALGTGSGGSGLTIDAGSVIAASGTVSASDAIVLSGDGAFLRVSGGGAVTITRSGASADDGVLSILANVTLSGTSIALNSSGAATVNDSAALTASNYDLGAQIINVGGGTGGLVLSDAVIAQMAGANIVILRGVDGIVFYDGTSLGTTADPIATLTLDTPTLTAEGSAANAAVTATNIVLTNSSGNSVTAAGGSGTLTLTALGGLTFGADAGDGKVTSGFGTIIGTAGTEILFSGTGSLDAGSANVTLSAPYLVVDSSASQSLTTTGALTIQPVTGSTLALAGTVYGGALSLTAGSITDSGVLIAQAGTVTLKATSGDITLSGNAAIDAPGTTILSSDELEYTPGGTVKLIADAGNITLGSGTVIDVSAAGSGYAGAIGLQADGGTVTLAGTLNGAGETNALGGTFILAAKALVGDLPISSGFTTEFAVSLSTGDIAIASGQTLTAATVLLEADGGWVIVNGAIDASGSSGGAISLFGTSGVDVEGTLLAKATTNGNSGGTVEIGTSGVFDSANGTNATYGYENLTASGRIILGSSAQIDVSGLDSSGNATDTGTVLIRAPILEDGSVNVSVASGLTIAGAKSKALEAYAVWSTTDATTGALHFDGIVDPAGWYTDAGVLEAGGFTNASGTAVASWSSGGVPSLSSSSLTSTGATTSTTTSSGTTTVSTSYGWDGATFTTTTVTTVSSSAGGTTTVVTAVTSSGTSVYTNGILTSSSSTDVSTYYAAVENYLLTYYYFTPTSANTDHTGFYAYSNSGSQTAGTLMGFVQSGLSGTRAQATATAAGLTLTPGIELRNPSSSINSGNVTVATNWNLGAENSSNTLVYRYNGIAPILTMRATNNVVIDASITDGFVENTASGSVTTVSITTANRTTSTSKYNSVLSGFTSMVTSITSANTIQNAEGYSATDLTVVAPASLAVGAASIFWKIYGSTAAAPSGVVTYLTDFNQYLTQTYSLRNNFSATGYTLAATTAANSSATIYGYAQLALAYLSQAQSAYAKINSGNAALTNCSYYAQYLLLWQAYYNEYALWSNALVGGGRSIGQVMTVPATYPTTLTAVASIGTLTLLSSAQADNSPAPQASASNYSPISSMDLTSETSSSSYRIVAGADLASANPDAVVTAAELKSENLTADTATGLTGSVIVDDHISYANSLYSSTNTSVQQTVSIGTVVRTGTGSIEIAAAKDFDLADSVAPGAVYTAGAAADTSSLDFTAPSLSSYISNPNGTVSAPAWAGNGGSVTVTVLGDIIGQETSLLDGETSWSEWYYHRMVSSGSSTSPFSGTDSGSNIAAQTAAWVNYATYADGIGALGGGNVILNAGGSIRDVIVSLPEGIIVAGGTSSSSPATEYTYGGGNLSVTAANIVASAFLVGQGTGTIRVAGAITTDSAGNALELAVQDGTITVIANGDITLSGISDPAMLTNVSNYTPAASLPGGKKYDGTSYVGGTFTSYGEDSGVTLISTSGNVALGTSLLAPASLVVDAFGGGITGTANLIPSSSGTITLLAGGDINTTMTMLDGTSSNYIDPLGGTTATTLSEALHADDDGSVIIYAGGDLYGTYSLIKQAKLYAGGDMVNVIFTGQNNRATDLTSIIAGGSIYADASLVTSAIYAVSKFVLYGPGDFLVEAGGDLGPFNTVDSYHASGIFAVGDGSNCSLAVCGTLTVKSWLPVAGADITVLYGVGAGVDYASAIADYVTSSTDGISFISSISTQLDTLIDSEFSRLLSEMKASGISQLEFDQFNQMLTAAGLSTLSKANLQTLFALQAAARTENGNLTPGQLAQLAALNAELKAAGFSTLTAAQLAASSAPGIDLTSAQATDLFQSSTLSTARRDLAVDRAFLDFLTQVATDYSDKSSSYYGKYGRAYEAISTLFPASLGYTDNISSSGASGAASTVTTGTMRTAHSVVETQTGGDIDILGPGGSLYVGSNSSDSLTPAQQGILTLQGGSVDIYTDQTVMVYQSRIFTEQGGDVDIFSANGDINAGKGKKSKIAYPTLKLVCDTGGYCRVSPVGLVSGAGIGALVTIPGQDADLSNMTLAAPHGTVDAGAAGIRVAGNLNIVALRVLNAFNISVGGTATGVPVAVAPSVNLGALSASDTAGSASNAIADAARSSRQTGPRQTDLPSIITIEVIGYGGGDDSTQPQQRQEEDRRRRAGDRQSRYDADDPIRVVGFGSLNPADTQTLTDEERRKLAQ